MKIFSTILKIKKSGFTLVETLVGLSLFSIALLSLMSVLASGVSDTNYAKQKILATYLNQEGIEHIRNMRDTFILYDPSGPQAGWDAFKAKMSPCENAWGCYFNADTLLDGKKITEINIEGCSKEQPCANLLYDPSTGRYSYNIGDNSGFSRKITMTPVSGTVNEVKISSTVSWVQGSGTYSVTFSEHLFNWVE